MLFTNFINRLYKVNSRFFVKDEQVLRTGFEDYPIVGLYFKDMNGSDKFMMAIPRIEVPEYSVYATDLTALAKYNPEELKRIETTGFASTKEKMIWRGWKAILNGLVKAGYIDINKTEHIFQGYHYEAKRMEYPRNYINRPI